MKVWNIVVILLTVCGSAGAQEKFLKHLEEAGKQLEAGNYNKGISCLTKALNNQNSVTNSYLVVDAYIYRALCYSSVGKQGKALADVESALKLKNSYQAAHVAKCQVLSAAGRHKESISWADTALAIRPGNPEILIKKANSLSALKQYASAVEALRAALKYDPNNVDALVQIGANYMRWKKWDSAATVFERVVSIDPTNAAALFDCGISKSFTADTAGARRDIEKAMLLDTSSAFIGYNNLGFFLRLEKGDYAGAIPYFERAVTLKPDFSYAYSNLGFAKLKMNDFSGSKQAIRTAIRLDETNSYAYKNLGLYNQLTGNLKKACKCWQKSAEMGYREDYDDEVDELLKSHCKEN